MLLVVILLLCLIIAGGWLYFVEPKLRAEAIGENEDAAIGSIMVISNATETYRLNHSRYPRDLAVLASDPTAKSASWRGMKLDHELFAGERMGYVFEYAGSVNGRGFKLLARPSIDGKTGLRRFFMDETGVIRYDVGQDPGPSSRPL